VKSTTFFLVNIPILVPTILPSDKDSTSTDNVEILDNDELILLGPCVVIELETHETTKTSHPSPIPIVTKITIMALLLGVTTKNQLSRPHNQQTKG